MRRLIVASTIAALVLCSGCAYMKMWSDKRQQKRQFKSEPSVALMTQIAPENVFHVEGPLEFAGDPKSSKPIGLLTVSDRYTANEVVSSRAFDVRRPFYDVFLQDGEYRLLAVIDLDGDGTWNSNEVVAQATVTVKADAPSFEVRGPALRVETGHPTSAGFPFAVPVRPLNAMVRTSLDDPFFDPSFGELGLYEPPSLFAHTQGFLFAFEELDLTKTQVLFVHGISGTPRDFKFLVLGLDRTRFQPWVFFYPSGMPIAKVGSILARAMRALHETGGSKKLVLVAHSMGGLVSRAALGELCADGVPSYLAGYVSFAAAYGGNIAAQSGVKHAPVVVPAWRDIATGSPFLQQLYQREFPKSLPFHLFFAWGKEGETGPEGAGDGTISLRSQLEPHMQPFATRLYGYGESHVGILNNEEVRKQFVAVLEKL